LREKVPEGRERWLLLLFPFKPKEATMRILILMSSLLLAACASMGAKQQTVRISTVENGQMLEGAQCSVINNVQRWDIITPDSLDIVPADGELHIRCDKDGYRSSELRIAPAGAAPSGSSVGLGLGGARGGFGSATGVGLGLSLPFGGAGSRGGFPAEISVTMTRQ